MIAIDSNILVYVHRRDTSQHGEAMAAIMKAANHADGWGFAVYSVAEMFRAVTHELAAGGPSTAADVRRYLESLTAAGGRVWSPSEGFSSRLLAIAEELGVRGRRIYDLQIGLTAREAGAREIWTNDRGFLAVPGLKVVNPF